MGPNKSDQRPTAGAQGRAPGSSPGLSLTAILRGDYDMLLSTSQFPVSLPGPPLQRSWPPPPRRLSLPPAPLRRSLPPCPRSLSLPAPPLALSLPASGADNFVPAQSGDLSFCPGRPPVLAVGPGEVVIPGGSSDGGRLAFAVHPLEPAGTERR